VAEKKRREPWPIALALALLFMIGVSVTFYFVASTHPDPVLTRDPSPGVED
jgi:hypothetical protein